jgi:hypothetical protein
MDNVSQADQESGQAMQGQMDGVRLESTEGRGRCQKAT